MISVLADADDAEFFLRKKKDAGSLTLASQVSVQNTFTVFVDGK